MKLCKFIILGVFLLSQVVFGKNNDNSVLLWNEDNNVSDFQWSKVIFLESGELSKKEASQWKVASRMTSFRIGNTEGLCAEHTKSEEWDTGHSDLWLIKKIQGIYYATTFEWLRPFQTCASDEDFFSLEDTLFGEENNRIVVGLTLSLPERGERTNVLWRNLFL